MNPMSTALDAAITALVAVAKAALPGTQVLDGPATERPERDTVVIGLGDPAAVTERSTPDFGGRVTETGDIICVISCWDGDTSVAAKRRRVFDIFAGLEAALREDPTLGGAVDDCIIGETGELRQSQQKGAIAALGFSIRYEAHI